MKKLLTIAVVLSMASMASAETLWMISDYYTSGEDAYLFSVDSTTGVAQTSQVWLPGVQQANGLAVQNGIAYISADTASGSALLKWDLGTNSLISSVPLSTTVHGLAISWDGNTLYGMQTPATGAVATLATINPATGAMAALGSTSHTAYPYFSSLAGIDPDTGRMWANPYYNYYEYWEAGNYTGTGTGTLKLVDDQNTAATVGSDGTLYIFDHGNWNLWAVDVSGASPATSEYVVANIDTANGGGWVPFPSYGAWAMSPEFSGSIPEPATMGLLAIGGIGALLRKRR